MTINSVTKYRNWYRQARIPQLYNGFAHTLFVFLVIGSTVIYYFLRLRHVEILELLIFPLVFVLGNLIEYGFHRFPLHHPVPGLRSVYQIHAQEHHRFFTHSYPAFESSKDFHTVFFPYFAPIALVLFLSSLSFFILSKVLTENISYLFVVAGCLYYAMYECLHFLHHIPSDLPKVLSFLNVARKYHSQHHDPRLMTRYNFNVTFPLGDWLFGTRFKQSKP